MGSAGVLNGLIGEEKAGVDGERVVGAILRVGGRAGVGANVFEEKDYAVDWTVEA